MVHSSYKKIIIIIIIMLNTDQNMLIILLLKSLPLTPTSYMAQQFLIIWMSQQGTTSESLL